MTGMEEENNSKIRVLNVVKKTPSAEAAEEGGGKEVCICSPTRHPGSLKYKFNTHRVLNLVKKSTSAEAAERGCGGGKEVCICSPTTHPGSFKCRLHRAPPRSNPKKPKATQNIGLSRFYNDVSQGIINQQLE